MLRDKKEWGVYYNRLEWCATIIDYNIKFYKDNYNLDLTDIDEVCPKCDSTADLVFLIDSSSSIS